MEKIGKTKFVESLNKALYDKKNGMRDISLIQRPLTWEQWKNVAPHMNFDCYHFERLFDDMPYKEWNEREIQDLAICMVDEVSFISAVLIDTNDENHVNVITSSGCVFMDKHGFPQKNNCGDFIYKYHIVNV